MMPFPCMKSDSSGKLTKRYLGIIETGSVDVCRPKPYGMAEFVLLASQVHNIPEQVVESRFWFLTHSIEQRLQCQWQTSR